MDKTMKLSVSGAGGFDGSTGELEIPMPFDFILHVGDKRYRMDFDKDGNLTILLVNGLDMKVASVSNCPAIKLYDRYH